MSIGHWTFERLSSVDFQESTIIGSPGLVIHQADILSNMRTAQFLCNVYLSQYFIKSMGFVFRSTHFIIKVLTWMVSHVPCGKGFCQPQLSSSGVDVREIENQFIGLTSSGYK